MFLIHLTIVNPLHCGREADGIAPNRIRGLWIPNAPFRLQVRTQTRESSAWRNQSQRRVVEGARIDATATRATVVSVHATRRTSPTVRFGFARLARSFARSFARSLVCFDSAYRSVRLTISRSTLIQQAGKTLLACLCTCPPAYLFRGLLVSFLRLVARISSVFFLLKSRNYSRSRFDRDWSR